MGWLGLGSIDAGGTRLTDPSAMEDTTANAELEESSKDDQKVMEKRKIKEHVVSLH